MLSKCKKCGEVLGFERHVCPRPKLEKKIKVPSVPDVFPASEMVEDLDVVAEESPKVTSTTYKYRDPEKRRAQVAEAMRRRRAKKAAERLK